MSQAALATGSLPNASSDATPANIVPVSIGSGSFASINDAFVSVTLCAPQTSNCVVIPNIRLDTGSIGLRIFRSTLSSLELPFAETPSGAQLAECKLFGGGSQYWGPIALADVILGGEKASSVPIQVVDSTYPNAPAACSSARPSPVSDNTNGLLGVAPGAVDCADINCLINPTFEPYYFSCASGKCAAFAPGSNLAVPNPITKFSIDNNGVVVQLPAVSGAGVKQLNGQLVLGIGTQTNNQVPPQVTALETDPIGWLHINWNKQNYYTMFDTGTNAWELPSGLNLPACSKNFYYACPRKPQQVNTTLLSHNGTARPFTLTVGTQFSFSSFALGNLGLKPSAEPSQTFMLGMPFFYGRSVYFGISGKSTPLGDGPYVAF
jgi:hypothetical protein